MTDEQLEYAVSLTTLAESLLLERDSILKQWFAEVVTSVDETLVEALSRQEFYDHIPDFLEHFCARLRDDNAQVAAPARQHGAHRWQQGLSFEEVIHEWSLLHRILIERVGELWAPIGLPAESLPRVYRLLADIIGRAIETSLSEYHTEQRAQADTRVHDLELVLLQQEDRDRTRGEGLHQVSHDLRGSLQTIRISSYLLKQQHLGEDARALVERLERAGNGLDHLLRGLLDLARLEAGRESCQVSTFDAAEVLRELVDANQSRAEAKGLSLIARGDDVLEVCSDEPKLRRIAQNLILNALDYTQNGVVEIGWRIDPPRAWSFYVRDSGPGMALSQENPLAANLEKTEHDVAKTTDRCARAAGSAETPSSSEKNLVHGEGIGLSIVHRLCKLLNAVLEVDSASGAGTMFRVQLPLHGGNADADPLGSSEDR